MTSSEYFEASITGVNCFLSLIVALLPNYIAIAIIIARTVIVSDDS